MRSFRLVAAAGALAAAASFGGGAAQADMASGVVLTNTCFSCHGTDGNSAGGMPTIAGKSEAFIVKQLTLFKAGKLHPTVMSRIAKGFTDAEIKALAKYFSGK